MALISRYETNGQLGQGSTGTVFRARDVVLERDVALKVLNSESRFSSRLLDLFFTDEQAASEWLHPNIATIHDLGQSPAGPFIATELLTGNTLRRHIDQRTVFSLEQKLDLFIQACNGLAHAHTKGVIHAAITPGSFFVNDKGQLKILDLGIRQVGRASSATGKLANLMYLSPEQIWEQSCDMRSDVFSTAIVFYEFLVNAHPFPGGVVPRRDSAASSGEVTLPEGDFPKSLEGLLKRTLNLAPEQRTQSAFELAASLRAIELEISSPLVHRFGDRPEFTDRPHTAPDKSWEGHSNVKAFLELLRQFEQNLAAKDWSAASHSLQSMKSLAAVPNDEDFIPAIVESEARLHRAQQPELHTPPAQPRAVGPLSSVRPISFPILGSAVVAILLMLAALIANWSRQKHSEPVLAQAQVKVPTASLLAASREGSSVLATLRKGNWVNILEPIPPAEHGFIRAAQAVAGKREVPSGYIRMDDLVNWRSDDAEVAWRLLALGKPAADSGLSSTEDYLADLEAYRTRFPTSNRTQAVDTEITRWREVLTNAAKPLSTSVTQPSGSDQKGAAQPLAVVPSPDALGPLEQEKIERILAQMTPMWDEGNLDKILELSQQALDIDPGNLQAKTWRSKARKAVRKLSSVSIR